jgi:hypothetical protein
MKYRKNLGEGDSDNLIFKRIPILIHRSNSIQAIPNQWNLNRTKNTTLNINYRQEINQIVNTQPRNWLTNIRKRKTTDKQKPIHEREYYDQKKHVESLERSIKEKKNVILKFYDIRTAFGLKKYKEYRQLEELAKTNTSCNTIINQFQNRYSKEDEDFRLNENQIRYFRTLIYIKKTDEKVIERMWIGMIGENKRNNAIQEKFDRIMGKAKILRSKGFKVPLRFCREIWGYIYAIKYK